MQDCLSPLDCVNLLCGGARGVPSRGSAVQREAWQSMQPKGARPAEPALQKHPVLRILFTGRGFGCWCPLAYWGSSLKRVQQVGEGVGRGFEK